MNFNLKYQEYKTLVENQIDEYFKALNCHDSLKSSMQYSLKAGGKRIRPVMFLACLDMLGCDFKNYLDLAICLEFIHTYSLIHDDLPALDNDDFRRGKPSNHKAFGEGIALLAGDGLLNSATEIALNSINDLNSLNAVKYLFDASGVNGMINGQVLDITNENVKSDESMLLTIDSFKTGKLLTAPLIMASMIANNKYFNELLKIGELTGKLFQFSDDLLDVTGTFENMGKTLGKDSASNKLTAISVYGESRTKEIIFDIYNEIINILKNIDNNWFFIDFYENIKNREN